MAGIAPAALGRAANGAAAVAHRPHGAVATSLAHGVAPLLLMVAPMLTGHAPAAVLGSVMCLVVLSVGYAPRARTDRWAREHVFDLWVMVLVMLLPLWGNTGGGHHGGWRQGAMPACETALNGCSVLSVSGHTGLIGIVAAWGLVRALLIMRSKSRADAASSAASGAVCALGLAWMLLA